MAYSGNATPAEADVEKSAASIVSNNNDDSNIHDTNSNEHDTSAHPDDAQEVITLQRVDPVMNKKMHLVNNVRSQTKHSCWRFLPIRIGPGWHRLDRLSLEIIRPGRIWVYLFVKLYNRTRRLTTEQLLSGRFTTLPAGHHLRPSCT